MGIVQDISPDIVLPVSDQPERDVFIAAGPGVDEILWLTAPKTSLKNDEFASATEMQLHSYRLGSEATTQPYRGLRRPHYVQRTQDGGVLFVSARMRDDSPNAWWTDRSLQNERRLTLGDGLADVRLSPAGSIWAAYIDDGVFGEGPGTAGLVRFDRSGRQTWEYDPNEAETDDISEVYAFNLNAEDDAWVYFYMPFVVVRCLRGSPTVWQTRVEGASALAVKPNRALLFGDHDDPALIRILDLPDGGGKANVKKKLRLSLPPRTNRRSLQAYGAADRLIIWSGTSMMILQNW
jgi:hypothetical protein